MKRNGLFKTKTRGGYGLYFFLLAVAALCSVFLTGCGGGTSKNYALDVSPRSVTLAPNQGQDFASNSNAPADASSSYLDAESVLWELVEGDTGGTIQAQDREGFPENRFISYTAPQTPGTYHLKATAHYRDGATKTSTAIIEVK